MIFMLMATALANGPEHTLFVGFGGSYVTNGNYAYTELLRMDPTAVYVNLASNPGGAAAALAAEDFSQVWVYDLSTSGADSSYTADLQAIADWYDDLPVKNVIADGRFLGSFFNNRQTTEGRALVENYYTNLQSAAGGIVLATDHNSYANTGMNDIMDLLGFNHFIGNFGGSFPTDGSNPLMSTPNIITSLANDTSTGQAPFGLQPNGLILDALGYHSGNTATPGISTTFDGALNLVVTLDRSEAVSLCDEDNETVMLTAAVEGATSGTVSYTWESDLDGVLGTGTTYVLDPQTLSEGNHQVRVIAQDNVNIDDAAVSVGIDVSCDYGCDNADEDGDGLLYEYCDCFDGRALGADYRVCLAPLTWMEAEEACDANGMSLVALDGPREDFAVQSRLFRGFPARAWWTSGNDLTAETFHVWGLWPFMLYTNWASGEPTAGVDDEDCVAVYPADGGWYDLSCDMRLPFVCEDLGGSTPRPLP
jgi:hypothetical protein